MIFCVWDYHNESIFLSQSQCDAEIFSVFDFQAAVHKQANAVHLSASTASNFFISELFPRFSGIINGLLSHSQ